MKLTPANLEALDFGKSPDGLLPAVVQHVGDDRVLMLGYVNAESLRETFESERVTFYSRSKGRLWTKGESSGHYLDFIEGYADCDRDAVLLLANPQGPTCHTGTASCFEEAEEAAFAKTGPDEAPTEASDATGGDGGPESQELTFLHELEQLLHARQPDAGSDSYTSRLLAKGVMKVAQKVGEEGVEMALEAAAGSDELLLEEAADLMYHYLLLLRAKGQRLGDVVEVLRKRH